MILLSFNSNNEYILVLPPEWAWIFVNSLKLIESNILNSPFLLPTAILLLDNTIREHIPEFNFILLIKL